MAEDTGLLSSNVSAGDDGLASQYNNLRADTKKMRQEEFNAGATINGATLPVPVYQNTTDNEVYACDANVATALNFIGFAISDGTNGNAIIVQHTGTVGGFSGLDEGELYYVQDVAGTIGTTKGTYAILVGIAISETELIIIKSPSMKSPIDAKAIDTEYQAEVDGFVCCYPDADTNNTIVVSLVVDTTATPTTVRARSTSSNIENDSICYPVAKGEYWKLNEVSNSGGITNVWFRQLN